MFRFSVLYLFYLVVATVAFLIYLYKKTPPRMIVSLIAGIGLLLLPPLIYYGLWLRLWAGTPVLVPDVTNLKLHSARSLIESVGLRIEVLGGTPEDQLQGRIVEQSPQKDMFARKGNSVVVRLQAGSPWVKVPSLFGETLEQATRILNALGLHLGGVSPEAIGEVVYQYPAPGLRLERGGTVEVGISE